MAARARWSDAIGGDHMALDAADSCTADVFSSRAVYREMGAPEERRAVGPDCGACIVFHKSVGAAPPSSAAAGARFLQADCGGGSGGGDGGAVANRRVAPAPLAEEVTDLGIRCR